MDFIILVNSRIIYKMVMVNYLIVINNLYSKVNGLMENNNIKFRIKIEILLII